MVEKRTVVDVLNLTQEFFFFALSSLPQYSHLETKEVWAVKGAENWLDHQAKRANQCYDLRV